MKYFLIVICLIVCFSSCGYKEGIMQKSEHAYIKFTGNVENAKAQIDLSESMQHIDGATLYQIPIGKHKVRVYKSGAVVVDRELFLDNQVTTEVFIP